MYCDGSFGPILLRSENFKNLQNLPFSKEEKIDLFVQNPDWRVLHCPDCMFYVYQTPEMTKESVMPLARKFILNRFQFENTIFDFTCNEAGIVCHGVENFDHNSFFF